LEELLLDDDVKQMLSLLAAKELEDKKKCPGSKSAGFAFLPTTYIAIA
jgi:hypothetical protein